MFIFGHLGIGTQIVSPWIRRLPLSAVLLGTLLPDLLDKPLYYLFGSVSGLICGTRTFGHTGLFLLAICLVTFLARSRTLAALALGVASHALLDNLSDRLLFLDAGSGTGSGTGAEPLSAWTALVWPWMGWKFSPLIRKSFWDYLLNHLHPLPIGGELVGLLLLVRIRWLRRHQSRILTEARQTRRLFRMRFRSRAQDLRRPD